MTAMDELDKKLNATFEGKVLRKDLLHRIKKGTNVPTFVLEFLLAKYCASNDQAEMDAGMEAALASLQENYVRPDEANAAQSRVATKGKQRFIDKVHVRYVEKEKRHWASLENFNSQRIAISERFYRDNDRLLEGGIWAEVTLSHTDIEEDDWAFAIEDLRPIQLIRFDFERYAEGRRNFTRDEWMAAVLRSVGLEASKLSMRVQMHFIARLAALAEANYNYIELGPRGTGKSYFFSEFSPYATLISGGQATKATLFYNNSRRKVGLVGFWDTVAFDEIGGIKIRDPDTIQIMKDFMANGRFSRGAEVIADASLSFVGNIDLSVQQLVHSDKHDLFQPLPPELDLAVMDRFAAYIPGWEMPKNSSDFLTNHYGFITDYLAEAFHHQFKHTNRYEEVTKRIRLGPAVEGRDEKGIKKTVCAFVKILHPDGPPSDEEFEQYVSYATECRRRVKEQMNKRKPDDEFARINLSYFNARGEEVIVFCPESKDAAATQDPVRGRLPTPTTGALGAGKTTPEAPALLQGSTSMETATTAATAATTPPSTPTAPPAPCTTTPSAPPTATTGASPSEVQSPAQSAPQSNSQSDPQSPSKNASQIASHSASPVALAPPLPPLEARHFTIHYGDTGYSYESIIGPYLQGARAVVIEEPYIRLPHQIQNFVRFCEMALKAVSVKTITLITSYEDEKQLKDISDKLGELKQSLLELDVELDIKLNQKLHDREIRIDNGWTIKIGRGLDFFQKPGGWFEVGANDLSLRKCLETKVDVFKKG